MPIEMTEDFTKALHKMENTDSNLFITGKAGTGKSTLLKYFRDNTGKNAAVLAPTGVAALNIGGQTVHSFFRFRPDVDGEAAQKSAGSLNEKGKALYRAVDMIVIDEASMLRADILDHIDIFLRRACNSKKAFGGKQMIFFGDLYQLPPVVVSAEKKLFSGIYESPYFFSAMTFPSLNMQVIELEKIFRQKDGDFIRILNAIRNNTVSDEDMAELNGRCVENCRSEDTVPAVTLTPRNDSAAAINNEKLSMLPGKEKIFIGRISGRFDESSLPAEKRLVLKKGALVMILANDPRGRWVNGSMGVISGFNKKDEKINVLLNDVRPVEIEPFEWDIMEYAYDEETGSLKSRTIGSFLQYPLRLAWAITIHKSQGKTFEKMVLDIGRGAFSPGQVYVALSRVRSLEGLALKKPLKKSHVFMDWNIVKFMTRYRYEKAGESLPLEERRSIIEDAIRDKKRLEIVYLKASDDKSRRIIRPVSIGTMEFKGKEFEGIVAYCESRGENRTFRLDRILEIKAV